MGRRRCGTLVWHWRWCGKRKTYVVVDVAIDKHIGVLGIFTYQPLCISLSIPPGWIVKVFEERRLDYRYGRAFPFISNLGHSFPYLSIPISQYNWWNRKNKGSAHIANHEMLVIRWEFPPTLAILSNGCLKFFKQANDQGVPPAWVRKTVA